MPVVRLNNAFYKIRDDLERRDAKGVALPLGVYPSDDSVALRAGYEVRYHQGQGEFSDQYEYRVVVDNAQLHHSVERLFHDLLPDEVQALYEEFSMDAFREADAWASEDPVTRERVLEAWKHFGPFFCEDGKCGFGAASDDGPIEIFAEEHGAVSILCGIAVQSRVEAVLGALGLAEREQLPGTENFEHVHRDVLEVDRSVAGMLDELDIKFSVVESLGMHPVNQHEGEPLVNPTPFWLHFELDMTFSESTDKRPADLRYGVTAEDHDEAWALAEECLRADNPGALVSRVIEHYRLNADDIGDEFVPSGGRSQMLEHGIWYQGELEYWDEVEG